MTSRRLGLIWIVAGLLIGSGVTLGAAASLSLASQGLTPNRTCTLTATPATTTVVADSMVQQGAPGSNFGTATSLNVASGNGVNRRIYLRFDLAACSPAVPATAIVRLATMRLYVTAMPTVCRTIDLFPVTASWSESTITWSNQPFGTAINNPPSASRTGSFGVGTPVGCQNRTTGTYIAGGIVTADVASFVAGSRTNFGWMLRDDVEGSATTSTVTFSSKNLGSVSQAPQLVITYVAIP